MPISIFTSKEEVPTDEDLRLRLGDTMTTWVTIREKTLEKYPPAIVEWHYPGSKYGWSLRIKDKKRAIIYLLPRDGYFQVAFVFGQKATDFIMTLEVSDEIKTALAEAKVYAEGRGIYIEVRDDLLSGDILRLVDVKLKY